MELRHTACRQAKLLSILRQELGMSSTLVKRLKYKGAFTVNGQRVFTDHPVRVGDRVCVCLDEPVPEYPAEDGALSILYEDDALIALDKPSGLLIHPSSARNTGTLANRLTAYYRRSGQPCAVHPVSRLDRDTFGVVLFAKSAHFHARMNAVARAGGLEKTYHAAVFGCPPESEGLIDAPIARVEGSSLLRCVRADGKPARTQYRVLAQDGGCSLLELHPLTGRTHQLRLHCAAMGCPILGDPQYGSPESLAFSRRFGLQGQQLCALRLRFRHPSEEKTVEIVSNQEVSLDFCRGLVLQYKNENTDEPSE